MCMFESKTMIIVLFINLVMLARTTASSVTFEADPAQLKSNLTEALSMRCSLTDHSDVTGSPGSTSDVHQVISIYVTYKDDEDVASVTSTEAPITYVDHNNLEAKGSVAGSSSQRFLQLSWKDPSQAYIGEYKCTVNGIDARGHIVQLSSVLTLTEVAPSLNDFVGYFRTKIHDQSQKIETLEHDKVVLEKDNIGLNDKIRKLENCTLLKVAFTAVIKKTGNFNVGTRGHPVKFDQVIINEGRNYDVNTGLFTCKIAGLYSFSIHVLDDPSSGHHPCLTLQQNNTKITSVYIQGNDGDSRTASATVMLSLQAGDTVGAYDTCGTYVYQDNSDSYQANVFTGHLVTPAQCG